MENRGGRERESRARSVEASDGVIGNRACMVNKGGVRQTLGVGASIMGGGLVRTIGEG